MRASLLHVVAGFTNHHRYQVRARLFRWWLESVLESGAQITVVQHTLGDRPHELTTENTPNLAFVNLVNLRGGPEYGAWLQHALYNRGFAALPEDAQYMCWQDTDVVHERPDWAVETLHMLQQHRVGQTWVHAIDKDPWGNVATNEWGNDVDRSFCAAWLKGDVRPGDRPYSSALLPPDRKPDNRGHTGFSWAIRKEALTGIGRLMDWVVAGSGDYFMAHGFAGTLRQMVERERSSPDNKRTPAYHRKMLEFDALCDRHIKQDIGCVPGIILHGWHGSKRLRFYGTREGILNESKFDPDIHIAYDVHGIPVLCDDNRVLRDGLRRYASRRHEDSVDVY